MEPVGSASPPTPLKRTAVADRHEALGARMVPFAGWLMPIQYTGILAEHRAVRSAAGLFDLGHMGQVEVSGVDAAAFLQRITTNDVDALAPGRAQYSLLPNPTGGVIDDIIVYRRPAPNADRYMVVVNASNAAKDVEWMTAQRQAAANLDVSVVDTSASTGMLAIQGPRAEAIARSVTDADLATVEGFHWIAATVAGVPVMVARTGYTGEDGFEIYAPIEEVGRVWDALLIAGSEHGLVPVGLGARDTLRLEARMPLYGNELADDINPLEAGLGWAVKLDKGDFVGRERIAAVKAAGPARRTVGFRLTERSGAPRAHYEVQVAGRTVGHVTSGAFSPTLGDNIGLALIERDAAGIGRPLEIAIRGKAVPAEQIRTPFYRRPAVVTGDAR